MKVEYGSIITEGSGKLGGTVFARNHRGYYSKTKVSPTNPQTARQIAVRQSLTTCTSLWEALTEDQRAQWNSAFFLQEKKDKFGQTIRLSGWNLFIKLNSALLNAGQSTISTPPENKHVAQPTSILAKAFFNNPGLFLFLLPSPGVDYIIKISATSALSPGVHYCLRQLRVIGYYDSGYTYPIDLLSDYQTVFGSIGAIGNKIFVEASYINKSTGFESHKWKTSCLIENDQYRNSGLSWFNNGNFFGSGIIWGCINIPDSDILLVGTSITGKIIRSTDKGQNWSDLGNMFGTSNVYRFAVANNNYIVAGCTGSPAFMIRSTDSGASWSFIQSLTGETYIRDICTSKNGIMFAVTSGSGYVYKSTDNGASWSKVSNPFSNTTNNCLITASNGTLIVCTSSPARIAISKDNGVNWSTKYTGPSGSALVNCYRDISNRILCSALINSKATILQSIDNGESWSTLYETSSQVVAYSCFINKEGVFIIGTGTAAHAIVSTDFGLSWYDIGSVVAELGLTSFAEGYSNNIISFTGNNGYFLNSNS